MLQELCTLRGHTEDRVWHVSWSPKGTHLASCGEDKVVLIWASSTSDWEEKGSIHVVATLEDAQTRTIRCCEWSPSSKHIACASFDGTVVVWEALNRQKTRWDQVAVLEGHENEVKSVAWSRSGQWLATCGRDKKVWVWERLQTKAGCEFECISMLDGHTQDVKFVQWHPRYENVLFSASYDDTVKVWSCDEDDDEFYCVHTLTGHSSTVWALAVLDTSPMDDDPSVPYSEPASQVLTCGSDLCLKLWEQDIPAGGNSRTRGEWRPSSTLEKLHKFPLYSVSWNADASVQCDNVLAGGGIATGSLIATGGGDNAINIVQVVQDDAGVNMLQRVQTVPEAHEGDINCVRWGPRELSSAEDADLFVSRLAGGAALPDDTRAYLPASNILASAADDGTVRLWTFVSVDNGGP